MSRISIPEPAAAPEGSQATLAAVNGKLGKEEVELARQDASAEPHAAAATAFARKVTEVRGKVTADNSRSDPRCRVQ